MFVATHELALLGLAEVSAETTEPVMLVQVGSAYLQASPGFLQAEAGSLEECSALPTLSPLSGPSLPLHSTEQRRPHSQFRQKGRDRHTELSSAQRGKNNHARFATSCSSCDCNIKIHPDQIMC